MKSIASWPFEIDNIHLFAFVDAFSREECEKIIKLAKKEKLKEANIGSIKGYVNKKVRDSKITWLYPCEELNWLFMKITDLSINLNNQFFNFDIFGSIEGLQFTTYKAPGGKYGKHVDRAYGKTIRKLSMSIQLSDPKNYEGGELCFYNVEDPIVLDKKQGQMIMFPSYVLHEVKPVTKGERISLVAWFTGKPFK